MPSNSMSAQGHKLNRRGLETRERFLAVAIEVLAESGPDGASANSIAKRAGLTWGTVNHQFGNVDGVWCALIEEASEGAIEALKLVDFPSGTLEARVREVIDLMWMEFASPLSLAVHNLRLSLPRDWGTLEREFPLTAAALREADRQWDVAWSVFFDGFDLSPTKARSTRALLPGALRGLRTEGALTGNTDVTLAKDALADALVGYLNASH